MKALLGLVAPTSGECAIFGKDSMKVDSRNEVGFLPENPYFYKHLSGKETLKFYGKLCGIRGAKLRDRVKELLELVDLQGASDRRIGGYSKGMLQRIGLAQALIQEPRLVILDEPTAGVDPVGSREIRDLIFKLREGGITVFSAPTCSSRCRRSAIRWASFSVEKWSERGNWTILSPSKTRPNSS